jgi:hypothetical protein
MRRAIKASLVVAALALIWAPTQARADGYISPWVAANASAGFSNGNVNFDNGRTGFGVNGGFMGAGIIGGEIGLGVNPSFFGTNNDFGSNSVIDLMGNLIVGIPIGGTHGAGVRPFATAGLGLIRRQIDGGNLVQVSSSANDFGWNAGAGVMGFFSDHVGLRGDVRYLRTINTNNTDIPTLDLNFSEGDFHFWRAAIGVVIR